MGENEAQSSNINITYETIFELLRREKNRDELQKLSETFYADVVSYLSEKSRVFSPQAGDMFSDGEREKTVKQVLNVKRMITELFERREKKIIILALNKVRTASSITDSASMLGEEKMFFNRMVAQFSEYRNEVLQRVLGEKQITHIHTAMQFERPRVEEERRDESPRQEDKEAPKQARKTKMIRILAQVPKFMGKELEVYGPFNTDDMANLPAEIAEVLIRKGRAEEIHVE